MIYRLRFALVSFLVSALCALSLFPSASVYAQSAPLGSCRLLVAIDQAGNATWDGPYDQTLEQCANTVYHHATQDTDNITYGIWNDTGLKIGPGGDVYLTSDGDTWEFWQVIATSTAQPPAPEPAPQAPTPVAVPQAPSTHAMGECRLLVGVTQQGNPIVDGPYTRTLEGCAEGIYHYAQTDNNGVVYGMWNNTRIKIGPGGDVYLSPDGAAWEFWHVLPPKPATLPDTTGRERGNDSVDGDNDGIIDAQDECPGQPETVNGILDTDGCPDTLEDLLHMATNDIDAFWRQSFAERAWGYNAPSTFTVYTMEQGLMTGCGKAPSWSAFYCTVDHGIYVDHDLMQQELEVFGDFAPVIIIAHEWSHAVQSMLGIGTHNNYVIQLEQNADCLAGAYARHADERGLLEEGDLLEAATSLIFAGDISTPWYHPEAHGGPVERVAAFALGYSSGIDACFVYVNR